MNPMFVGDSYDIVKRFFIAELRTLGYSVKLDALFTGDWKPEETQTFLTLISMNMPIVTTNRSALFLDPDTGVREKRGPKHITFDRIAEETRDYEIVVAFDQSFSHGCIHAEAIADKIKQMTTRNCHSMFYDSHARFLFASRKATSIRELRQHLISLGLPRTRLHEASTA
jgi:hypothetical protein